MEGEPDSVTAPLDRLDPEGDDTERDENEPRRPAKLFKWVAG